MSVSRHNPSSFFVALVGSALLLSAGCASNGGGAGDETSAGQSVLASGKQVRSISITLGAGLTEQAAQIANQHSLAGKLDSGIRGELGGKGPSDSGTISVDVEIIGFRVRSTASAIWWGVMAGADTINVEVTISENDETLKTFKTGTSTALGGFAYGSRDRRITRMLKTLSKRIAVGI